jgi:hypothetical protein
MQQFQKRQNKNLEYSPAHNNQRNKHLYQAELHYVAQRPTKRGGGVAGAIVGIANVVTVQQVAAGVYDSLYGWSQSHTKSLRFDTRDIGHSPKHVEGELALPSRYRRITNSIFHQCIRQLLNHNHSITSTHN